MYVNVQLLTKMVPYDDFKTEEKTPQVFHKRGHHGLRRLFITDLNSNFKLKSWSKFLETFLENTRESMAHIGLSSLPLNVCLTVLLGHIPHEHQQRRTKICLNNDDKDCRFHTAGCNY